MIQAIKNFLNRNKPATLPDKASALIRVALLDLAKIEADPFYRIDMTDWHRGPNRSPSSFHTPTCAVCFAGAVMAKSLKAPFESDITPGEFDYDTSRKLAALDDFRRGDIRHGLETMGIETMEEVVNDMAVADYYHNPERFRADMTVMADYLEERGL